MIERLLIRKNLPFQLYEVNLKEASEEDLLNISMNLGLSLSLDEMKKIKEYFMNKGRNPTDVELQALGQAWSEHCCYKSSKVPLKMYLFDVAKDRIVTREDAGVMEFDEDHYYVVALESHNHPSAIEPYGGASTGIGGVVRDVICMGAQPIALIDPLFFGPLDCKYEDLPKGVKHPRYLFKGVVDGIRDYGNRIGIPTLCGQVFFHGKYIGNCLVNVGCIGIMKKRNLVHSTISKPGDILVYVGGRTGRDGIHGVTFASAELTEESEEKSRSAVQIGDPIMKEPLMHATLECVEKGLLEGLKDFGGGGLSCVCGELAYNAGVGVEVELDKIPLKEIDMAPWEIWISESQERMMFVVDEKNLEEVLHICKKWDVLAVPIGKAIGEKVIRVFYRGFKVLELDVDFQVAGPVYDSCKRPHIPRRIEEKEEDFSMPNLERAFLKVVSSPNVSSREWIIRQYDHEVRGCTVIKPLQGIVGRESHGDAAVIKPLENSFKGIAVTADVNPNFLDRNPYWGACSAVDEVCRNLVAVGAKPDSIADCLNFGNPEKSRVMGDFYEVCRGLSYMARSLNIPFISGNVSFYNECNGIAVPPTPQLTAIGLVPDIRKCVTVDFKKEGNPIYLVGETKRELGGSEYYRLLKLEGGVVPRSNPNLLKRYMDVMLKAIWKGYIGACHDLSEGGFAVCIAEMAIGGWVGADVDIGNFSNGLREDFKLFSESNTRWLVEVKEEKKKEFERLMKEKKLKFYEVGIVTGERLIVRNRRKKLINLDIDRIDKAWRRTIWNTMG